LITGRLWPHRRIKQMASSNNIKSAEALAAYNGLIKAGRFAKRPALEKLMAAELSVAAITDEQFEKAMTELRRRVIRVRGFGGGITLVG
jgi:tagatose-1,6-bisphosphate aldolase